MWVPLLACSLLLLLTLPILPSPECECLCWLALFWPCWCCLSSSLQDVSASACLLSFSPADDASPFLSSWWVPLFACSLFTLLMLPVLSSPECECLCLLALFCYWCCLFSILRMWVPLLPCSLLPLLMLTILFSPVCECLWSPAPFCSFEFNIRWYILCQCQSSKK